MTYSRLNPPPAGDARTAGSVRCTPRGEKTRLAPGCWNFLSLSPADQRRVCVFPPASFFRSHRTSIANLVSRPLSDSRPLRATRSQLWRKTVLPRCKAPRHPHKAPRPPHNLTPSLSAPPQALFGASPVPSGGAQFLGIPYAEPPVGPLRWRAPVPKKPWTGVREANAFGSSCSQALLGGAWNRHDAENSSEDCLYLNVITPAWPAAKPLPVMFWIHGGANLGGSGSGSLYSDGTLIQSRRSPSSPSTIASASSASSHIPRSPASPRITLPATTASWTRSSPSTGSTTNIARFGGDPNNVTVFGQSAGSMDTGILMAYASRARPLPKSHRRKWRAVFSASGIVG